MATSTKRRRGRAIVTGLVCLALACGAAYAIAARKPKTSSTVEEPSIFKTATVSQGDLTTTERIDGVVQLSATLPVLHRIEGQTSSTTSTSASANSNSNANANANASTTASSNPAGPSGASSALLAADCATPSTAAATVPPDTTTPATVDTTPVDTTVTESPTTTTSPVVDTTPAPTTTTPAASCDTTTTSAPATTETTVPAGGRGRTGAGGFTGGGATRGGSGSSSSSTASNVRVTQTITSITTPNTPVSFGDVLYTVDGQPVVALQGALPAWRSLSTALADGADVAQLEAGLVALGYDPQQKVTVDDHFDSATRTMVKAWQKGLGIEQTGTVPLGSVVFLPAATTVSTVDQSVGDTVGDGDTVMTLATSTQQVLVDVPAGDEAAVVPGLQVGIGDVQGTVSRLQSADQNGSVAVEAVITPSTEIKNADNGSSVKVTLTLTHDSGVLIVPAEAIVSRLDGTYAVEVKAPDGTTAYQTVEMLGVSGANVAIRGADVSEGTVVLLPA